MGGYGGRARRGRRLGGVPAAPQLTGLSPRQRHARFLAAQAKCTGARNDYLLHLRATNAVISNYYLRDVSNILDVRGDPGVRAAPPPACSMGNGTQASEKAGCSRGLRGTGRPAGEPRLG